MLAAEEAFAAITNDRSADILESYEEAIQKSWIIKELKLVRSAQPDVGHWGGKVGTLYAGLDMWLGQLGLGLPWTLKHKPDHESLVPKEKTKPIDYPKPDGVLTFDRLSSVFVSNTNNKKNRPVNLPLKSPDK